MNWGYSLRGLFSFWLLVRCFFCFLKSLIGKWIGDWIIDARSFFWKMDRRNTRIQWFDESISLEIFFRVLLFCTNIKYRLGIRWIGIKNVSLDRFKNLLPVLLNNFRKK